MGYVSIFVEEGSPIAALLQQARASSSVPSYVDKLLAAFGSFELHVLSSERGAAQSAEMLAHLRGRSPWVER